ELFLGMLEWLNHSPPAITAWPWLTLLGVVAGGASLWLARRSDGGWLMLLAAGTLGWAVACGGARAANIAAMPLPNAKRSYTKVMIDQGINGAWSTDHHAAGDVILPKDGFIAGVPKGFGIFERWILRLGYFFHRAIGKDVFSGDLAVLIYPSKRVSGNYIDALVSYVNGG